MFVRRVRATVVVLAIAWASSAAAQDVLNDDLTADPYDQIGSEISAFTPDPSDETSLADPAESFVVEHSNTAVAAAPRETQSAPSRCREYLTDDGDPYDGGFACPQADGSWRIVSGPEEVAAEPRAPESRREERPRPRASYSQY